MILRKVLRHITLLNLILLSIIAAALFYAYSGFVNLQFALPPLKIKAPSERQETKTEAEQTQSSAEYSIIADQNLFHPERIIPPEKKADEMPKPDFVLYGTLLTDDVRIAYIEDLKAPHNTAGRGKRQRALRLGQALSGYTLKEVHHDRILMAKAEDVIEININANRKAKKADAAPSNVASPAVQPSPAASSAEKTKAGGQPPGVVHTGPLPAGVQAPDAQTISRVKETFGQGIIKRQGIQRQTE